MVTKGRLKNTAGKTDEDSRQRSLSVTRNYHLKSENTGKVFGQIRAQTTRARFQEQVIQRVQGKRSDAKGYSLKHVAVGKKNKAKQKKKDVFFGKRLMKEKYQIKKGGNLVFCKTKESHKIRAITPPSKQTNLSKVSGLCYT